MRLSQETQSLIAVALLWAVCVVPWMFVGGAQ